MEKIDLNNYEAYFLDFMEGNLGAEGKKDLFDFLMLHPDLKAELEIDFGGVELFPEYIEFDDKPSLKLDKSDLIVSLNSIDDFMIASIECELSTKHEGQLQAYIQKEKLDRKYAAYKATKLLADKWLVYPDKKGLKKETQVIPLSLFKRIAAIAAIGLILIGFGANWDSIFINNVERYSVSFAKLKWFPALIKSHTELETLENDDSADFDSYESPTPKNDQAIQNVAIKNIERIDNTDLVIKEEKLEMDTSENRIEPIDKIDFKAPENDDLSIVQNPQPLDSLPNIRIIKESENDPIFASANTIRREEPYKIVTTAASDMVNRNIYFTRDKDIIANEYVAYSFKFGKFEFERKKAR